MPHVYVDGVRGEKSIASAERPVSAPATPYARRRLIRSAIRAFVERDPLLAGEIVDADARVNEAQRAVTEAVTGVIALDNTLVVTRHFGALPDEVVVVEVEPAVHEFGDTFSEVVERQLDGVCELVRVLATRADAVAQLPRAPLGDPSSAGVRAP